MTEADALEVRKDVQKGFIREFENCINISAAFMTEVAFTQTWCSLNDSRWRRFLNHNILGDSGTFAFRLGRTVKGVHPRVGEQEECV